MMMLNSPRDYFNDYVLHNFEEYKRDKAKMQTALNAVLSSYHLSDWLYIENGANKDTGYWKINFPAWPNGNKSHRKKYEEYLAGECPYLGTLKAIANGTKHMYDPSKGHIKPHKYIPVARPWGPIGWPRNGAGMKQFPSLITVQHDGREIDIYTVLLKTIQWWPNFLTRHKC